MKIFRIRLWVATLLGVALFSPDTWSTEKYIYSLLGEKRQPSYLLKFQGDGDFQLLKKIDLNHRGVPRGIVAHADSAKMYFTIEGKLFAYDLLSGKIAWERETKSLIADQLHYDVPYRLNYLIGDRLDISKDGKLLYLPAGFWSKDPFLYVLDLEAIEKSERKFGPLHLSEVKRMIEVGPNGHNVSVDQEGTQIFMSSVKSRTISVIDAHTLMEIDRIGPFDDYVRPYVYSADHRFVFANLDHLLGFSIADREKKTITRIQVLGFPVLEPVSHSPTPSHGIALSPDESEVWVVNNPGRLIHVFANENGSVRQKESIALNGHPGWLSFSVEGDKVFASTGDIISTRGTTAKSIIGTLKDEDGRQIESEKILDVHIKNGKVISAGNQFANGRF